MEGTGCVQFQKGVGDTQLDFANNYKVATPKEAKIYYPLPLRFLTQKHIFSCKKGNSG